MPEISRFERVAVVVEQRIAVEREAAAIAELVAAPHSRTL